MNWVVKSTSWTAEAKYLKTKKTYFVLLMVFFLWELMPAGFIAVFVVLWVKKPQYVPKEEVQGMVIPLHVLKTEYNYKTAFVYIENDL